MVNYGFNRRALMEKNAAHGGHFFSRGAMRFFNSRLSRIVAPSYSGAYYVTVTSEQFIPSDGRPFPRMYTVRLFDYETGADVAMSEDAVAHLAPALTFQAFADKRTAEKVARIMRAAL